jgi:hypothetical protein
LEGRCIVFQRHQKVEHILLLATISTSQFGWLFACPAPINDKLLESISVTKGCATKTKILFKIIYSNNKDIDYCHLFAYLLWETSVPYQTIKRSPKIVSRRVLQGPKSE